MELARRIRPVRLEEVRRSYQQLKDSPCEDPGRSQVGTKTLDAFFLGHRLKARTKSHISFAEAMTDPKRVAHLKELVVRYRKKPLAAYTPDQLVRMMYYAFQLYFGTINQFRPAAAKWVYCQLKPQVGILDFSAGWGGRALAAMSMGIPYYGFDANTALESAYKRMIAAVDPKAAVQIQFQPSETVDFSRYKYDLVFTSPPYFMIEEYEKMPAYGSKQAFLEKFFQPVVKRVWKHLLPGGNMALNMPEEMYEAVKSLLPPLHHTILLPLGNRHPTNAVKGQRLGKEDDQRYEYIYVWHKRGRVGTRRQSRANNRQTRKNVRL